MKFYGVCLLLLAGALLLLPLMTADVVLTETVEEPIAVVAEPLEIIAKKEESLDKPTMQTIKTAEIGNFRIQNLTTGAVEEVDGESFVLGALCSEMPATFHPEALKAQAVSARTWAVYQRLWQEEHPDERLDGGDFQADPLNWKGYVTVEQAKERFGEKFEEYWDILSAAAEATKGQILCADGQPIAAAYHAISAGKTEAAEFVWGSEVSYLQAVDSRGDELAPGFEEEYAFSESDMKTIFSAVNFEGEPAAWFEILERSPSGYVTEIRVGNVTMSGREFRSALNLRSSHFTITAEENKFEICTKGYGHGAGLSQYGADFMARQGSSYEEILRHYYSGAELCFWDNFSGKTIDSVE